MACKKIKRTSTGTRAGQAVLRGSSVLPDLVSRYPPTHACYLSLRISRNKVNEILILLYAGCPVFHFLRLDACQKNYEQQYTSETTTSSMTPSSLAHTATSARYTTGKGSLSLRPLPGHSFGHIPSIRSSGNLTEMVSLSRPKVSATRISSSLSGGSFLAVSGFSCGSAAISSCTIITPRTHSPTTGFGPPALRLPTTGTPLTHLTHTETPQLRPPRSLLQTIGPPSA